MRRRIIQLSEEQDKAARERAQREGISVAELMRRSLDDRLSRPFITDEMRERAKAFAGIVRDVPDLSVNHDKYFAEAIERDHLR